MVVPAFAVFGVGAVALPVPPVGVVYHNKLIPVAVNGQAAEYWQYEMYELTSGGFIDNVRGSQTIPGMPDSLASV
jgi:hypothetical protein